LLLVFLVGVELFVEHGAGEGFDVIVFLQHRILDESVEEDRGSREPAPAFVVVEAELDVGKQLR
jgi:hypothetical protein